MPSNYQLLDCGNQKKVEIFGDLKIIRPCPQALWRPVDASLWENWNWEFVRIASEKGVWLRNSFKFPYSPSEQDLGNQIESINKSNVKIDSEDLVKKTWIIESEDLKWQIQPNEFGNIGIFTEHWIYANSLAGFFEGEKILNLFTYSGSNCVNLVRDNFLVTAVDSSRSAMSMFAKNLELNSLDGKNKRLILEDAIKFITREARRGTKYDGIMIDAPSYGRGTKGEIFSIEDGLVEVLYACHELLSEKGKLVLTLHSPRFTPAILEILVGQIFGNRKVEATEIIQTCESGIKLPSGFLVKVW